MDIPFISLDLALMIALLERWRPETHIFHLGSSEWTVTLQDVDVLLRVPVDGLLVVGSTEQNWDNLCKDCWYLPLELVFKGLGASFGFESVYLTLFLDILVVWRPYDELIETLPLNCHAGKAIWMAKVPLICFPYMQNHMPDRVMRQFGYRQTIPDDCDCRARPHELNFKSGTKDYAVFHANSVALWNDRLNHIVSHADVDIDVYLIDNPYVLWYRRINLRYISRLSAAADTAMGLFERLRTMDVSDIEALPRIGEQGVECSWFESPVANVGGVETSFLDPPLVKKRKRLDEDGEIDVGDQVAQLRVDTLTFEGHPSEDVQDKGMVTGEGSGVLT
ncbi:hypothetical protein Vadar_030474 [Vaccinium darrowii]|uniref:Uncharacterized protein n=1 Tax=Vaccinium darrowii TaxID=229202 RepID=A0ACB7ZF28_9ERIC|nr:hypothetical protein Vadar_030474 [Vaccinium darrowii]